MDQLKEYLGIAGRFLVTYRFWLSLGLVVIFSIVTYPSGSRELFLRANSRKKALDQSFDSVKKYTAGAETPNPSWSEAVTKTKQTVSTTTEGLWETLYRDQQKLMTWPTEVSAKFSGRPFGVDLTTKEERSTQLVIYRLAFPNYVIDNWLALKPMVFEAGKLTGVIDAPLGIVRSANFKRPPTSLEAWLAQEEIWVQRSIYDAIAKCNAGSESWSKAKVKSLNLILMGQLALDSRARFQNVQLQEYASSTATTPGSAAGGNSMAAVRIDPIRYLEKTPQYRTIPVFVSMMVDQMQIPKVVATLAEADFHYTISHVNVLLAEKYEVPEIVKEAGGTGDRGGKDDPIYNSFQVEIWGTMRIYEMPPKMKAEYEERQKKAATPAAEEKKAS